MLRALVAVAALGVGAPLGHAAQLDLTYKDTIEGTPVSLNALLEGTLGVDNNTFTVTWIDSAMMVFNGTSVSFSYFASPDAYNGLNQAAPTLTLNGSYLDFFVCYDANYCGMTIFCSGRRLFCDGS